ncbi:hypothetical protein TEA_013592 [Camellia sinensis var. sinensis]|uniref:Uncharacterized protein n=1 Tax=Camellia sinensis var. sinensis TaxID=542762 RepID=A0A4S4EZL8_CAMSN|nr:hypothetical protein TEA_013592 [Camellia sinensis var. sinensis]
MGFKYKERAKNHKRGESESLALAVTVNKTTEEIKLGKQATTDMKIRDQTPADLSRCKEDCKEELQGGNPDSKPTPLKLGFTKHIAQAHFGYECITFSTYPFTRKITPRRMMQKAKPSRNFARTAFRFIIPYQNKARTFCQFIALLVELQYLHDYVGISAGAGLTTTPLLNFSGVLGSGFFSIGTDISFDVGARQFAKYNAGLSFNTAILITSLTLNDKGDTLRASCHHTISPLTDTAIAAELTHKFLRNETTLTFGTQHAFFPITLVKARASSNGRLGALVQQELFPSFLLTVAGDVDVWDVMRSAKLGLSLAFRP